MHLPKITILADKEINIENHKGVINFEEDEVKINTSLGPITIYGKNFKILFIGGTHNNFKW